jgi:hypothetical protein
LLPTPNPPESTAGRLIVGVAGYVLFVIMMLISLIQVGLFDLETLSLELRPSILLPLGVTLYIAYRLPQIDSLSEIFE